MARGRKYQEFQEYLTDGGGSHVDHDAYASSPASAFLKYTIEAKTAVDLCMRHLPKNKQKSLTAASQDTLEHLVAAFLPAIMGHFETYQRYLFAGVFDYSVYLEKFDVSDFLKRLKKECDFNIDPNRVSAYRNIGASSVGLILSDSLNGWHSPEKVNKYFQCFGVKKQLFGNTEINRIKVLWQLRHSLVHTGGTLSIADSQKIEGLKKFGGKNIVFSNNFIFEVSRKMHPIILQATNNVKERFSGQLIKSVTKADNAKLDQFFEVKSSVAVWLK